MNIFKHELEKLENFEGLLKEFNIEVADKELLFNALCTDRRCHELGILRSSALAVIGDAILDCAALTNREKLVSRDFDLYTKEKMNSFRTLTENPRLKEIMRREGLNTYLMEGNQEKVVDRHLSTCFEAIIFVIYDQCGMEFVAKFLEGISFYK